MSHSYVIWLISMWHDSLICVQRNLWHDLHTLVMCHRDMSRMNESYWSRVNESYVQHKRNVTNVTWLIDMWHVSCIRDMTYLCVTWLVDMCGMTPLVDMCVIWLMSHMKESHIWKSHVKYERVSHMKESCHIWKSHPTHKLFHMWHDLLNVRH